MSAILRNAIRAKNQDDLQAELQELREYDLSTEKITADSQLVDSGKDIILLIKHEPEQKPIEENAEDIQDVDTLLKKTLSHSDLDDSRLFKAKTKWQFSRQESVQEMLMTVKADGSKIDYFDLDELKGHSDQLARQKNPAFLDQANHFIDTRIRGAPNAECQYMTRGLRNDKSHEFLIIGPLSNQNNNLMLTPRFVIGSDRLKLYDFFSRRKEVWNQQAKNWLKLSVAITGLHFLSVQVPTFFSRFFGDEVGIIGQKMGAEDQSQLEQQLAVAREHIRETAELSARVKDNYKE